MSVEDKIRVTQENYLSEIKFLRERYYCLGLKEAKEFIEALKQQTIVTECESNVSGILAAYSHWTQIEVVRGILKRLEGK